jgi:putative hydrolase of the HAD superfamily
MGLAYRSFVEEGRLPEFDPHVEQQCIGIGWDTYDSHPDLKDGAREVLETLRPHVRLALATRGDEELQGRRLDHAGLRHHFDALYFLEWKNRETYGALLGEQGLKPATTFIIGDAIRSDINPALELGAHAILVRGQNWEHERVPPVGDSYHEVDRLDEIPALVFKAMGRET